MPFDGPKLVLTGTAPIGASALLRSKMVKVVPGEPHRMCSTLKEQSNAELLAFLRLSWQAFA